MYSGRDNSINNILCESHYFFKSIDNIKNKYCDLSIDRNSCITKCKFFENLEEIYIAPRINPQGKIYLCTLFDDDNYIGDINNNLTEEKISDSIKELRNILKLEYENNEDCKNCFFKRKCKGGCPRLSFKQSGHYIHDGLCSERILKILLKRKNFKFDYGYIEVTSKCNLNCSHCILGKKNQLVEIDFNILKTTIDHLIENGLSMLYISGGEPLLYTYINDFFVYINNKKSIKWGIVTNGTLLDKNVINDLLICNNFEKILISLDGSTSNTNDLNRGVGTFNKVINSLEQIKNTELIKKVVLQMAVGKFNYNEIESFIKLCNNYGVEYSLIKINILGNAKDNANMFKTNYNEDVLINKKFKENNIIIKDSTLYCHLVDFNKGINIEIDYFGNVYLCKKMKNYLINVGNIYSDKELINRKKYLDLINDIFEFQNNKKDCLQCMVKEFCKKGCYIDFIRDKKGFYNECDSKRKTILKKINNNLWE